MWSAFLPQFERATHWVALAALCGAAWALAARRETGIPLGFAALLLLAPWLAYAGVGAMEFARLMASQELEPAAAGALYGGPLSVPPFLGLAVALTGALLGAAAWRSASPSLFLLAVFGGLVPGALLSYHGAVMGKVFARVAEAHGGLMPADFDLETGIQGLMLGAALLALAGAAWMVRPGAARGGR